MRLIADVEEVTRKLGEILASAGRAVIFTGAGVSTESGIPDFRSPGGLWTRMRPIEFGEFLSSEEARLEDWRRRFEMGRLFARVQPNVAHRAIARLVLAGRVAGVITQNIDGLHGRAGVPAERLVEIHGVATRAACLGCGRERPLDEIEAEIERTGRSPRCAVCGAPVKCAIVSFGQPMPEMEMLRAEALAEGCDLFVAVGSSLAVWPAAGLPLLAQRYGAPFVIVNRDETELDHAADLVLHGPIGRLFGPLAGEDVADPSHVI